MPLVEMYYIGEGRCAQLQRTDYIENDECRDLTTNFQEWKTQRLKEPGWFPVFAEFKELGLLRGISGNALKLYIYLGIHSKNLTGESWHSLSSIAKYFDRSERTISNWLEELKNLQLIERIQPNRTSSAITFLKPYNSKGDIENE